MLSRWAFFGLSWQEGFDERYQTWSVLACSLGNIGAVAKETVLDLQRWEAE